MARRRLMFAASIFLVVAECLFFLYLVVFGWTFRSLMLNPGDPLIAIRTRTVYANAAWLAVNVIGLIGYVYRRDGFGSLVLLLVLTLDILNSLYAAAVFVVVNSDPGTAVAWLLEALVPAAALALALLRGPAAEATRGG